MKELEALTLELLASQYSPNDAVWQVLGLERRHRVRSRLDMRTTPSRRFDTSSSNATSQALYNRRMVSNSAVTIRQIRS